MGFNAPLDQYLRADIPGGQLAHLPAGVGGPTLRAVLSSSTGQSWWAGLSPAPHPTLFLNITKGSQDMQVLGQYLKQQNGVSRRGI